MSNQEHGNLGMCVTCYIPLVCDGSRSIRTPADVLAEMSELQNFAQEVCGVLYLNSRNNLMDKKIVTVGVTNSCLVHPCEVFRQAIQIMSSGVVLCHNHPAGNPEPTADDLRLTREMIEAGKIVGIKVMDHVIIGRKTLNNDRTFISIREGGLCEFSA